MDHSDASGQLGVIEPGDIYNPDTYDHLDELHRLNHLKQMPLPPDGGTEQQRSRVPQYLAVLDVPLLPRVYRADDHKVLQGVAVRLSGRQFPLLNWVFFEKESENSGRWPNLAQPAPAPCHGRRSFPVWRPWPVGSREHFLNWIRDSGVEGLA